MINISNFDELLNAARQQTEPQRMLFVFAQSELPDEHDMKQAQRFKDGQGGSLNPIMFVDKTLDELSNFSTLVQESKKMGQHWDIVFAAALDGKRGHLPSSGEAEEALNMMVKSIQQGLISNFLAYDRAGNQIRLY